MQGVQHGLAVGCRGVKEQLIQLPTGHGQSVTEHGDDEV